MALKDLFYIVSTRDPGRACPEEFIPRKDIKADLIKTCRELKKEIDMKDAHNYFKKHCTDDDNDYDWLYSGGKNTAEGKLQALMEWAGIKESDLK